MKLKELRLQAVMSQRSLAIASGVAFTTICRLEKRKQKPNYITINKLATALHVPPNSIDW